MYSKQLVAAHVQRVVVLPDNDEPGRQHADAVAASCHRHGLEVKVVALPGLPPKGDISDFLSTYSADDLAALVQQTTVYAPPGNGRPSPNSCDAPTMPLATLLAMIHTFIRQFVVLTDEQAHAIALWVAHTYLFDAADATPYLSITSAVKRSGKTQLLEVLEFVVHRPWLTGRVSAAVLTRKVDAERPTLLLDESDATFNQESDNSEALRGLLNSGYRASGTSSSCVGQGGGLSYKDFSTFCPKAIAGIGSLPDTVRDRAIVITLKRRTRDETIQRFRQRLARGEAAPIRDELARWASAAVLEVLRVAEPALPGTLNDRAQDVWEPLLAIADLAGGEWPRLATEAATTLAGSFEDDDIGVELLSDIRNLLETLPPGDDFVATTVLLEYLVALDERPWATWRKAAQPLTGHGLRRQLQPFGIRPDRGTVAGAKVRGYRRDAFEDAIARYLPIKVAKWSGPNKTGPEPVNSKWSEDATGTACKNE